MVGVGVTLSVGVMVGVGVLVGVSVGVKFIQTASCTQNQIAYRQDREQSVVTGAIRQIGSPVAMYQAIPKTASRNSVGTKPEVPVTPPGECKYGLGGYVWTYAPTVESGKGFAALLTRL